MAKREMKVDRGGRIVDRVSVDFPSNSHSSKEKKEPEKEVKQITKGKVTKQKKSLGKKFAETFLGDDIESVSSYILHDVIIPSAKNLVSDTITNSIEMLLFGQVRGSRTRRDRGRSYVSYDSYSTDRNRGPREFSRQDRSRHNFDDIIIEERGEAEMVLSHLVELIDIYGEATVADLYDLVGITSNYTDHNYGWDNLSMSRVERVRDGYMIEMPRPISLK